VISALLASCLLLPVLAQDGPSHVKAELFSERAVEPGKPLTVGVRLTMSDGFHTYWRNPGDSGLATTIQWKRGLKAGEIQWPYPERLADSTGAAYVYNKEATLLIDIPGYDGKFPIAAKVGWLECKDVCVPGEAEVTLAAAPRPKEIAAARAKLPKPLPSRIPAALKPKAVFAPPSVVALGFGGLPCDGVFFPYSNKVIENKTATSMKVDLLADPPAKPYCELVFVPAKDLKAGASLDGVYVAAGTSYAIAAPVTDYEAWRKSAEKGRKK
jgi:thiol:disulfide interchange protein DsbD